MGITRYNPTLGEFDDDGRYGRTLQEKRAYLAESEAGSVVTYDDHMAEIARAEGAKDTAYKERNALVNALCKLFPASLERHPDSDTAWEDDWRWIVFIDLPTGQATWHIHDSEVPAFSHLPRGAGRTWDGHTTEEKYRRLEALSVGGTGTKE